jgi:hypothetical protein
MNSQVNEGFEQRVREILHTKPVGQIITRDGILDQLGIAFVWRSQGKPIDPDQTLTRRRVTKLMTRIVDEGAWEYYGSPRRAKWRRVS